MSKTEDNLKAAFAGESQARNKYTYFAEVAEQEGHHYIAKIFRETADNERIHAMEEFKLLNGIGDTVANLKAAITRRAACRSLRDLPEALRRTMTLDNGKEFAEHDQLAEDLELDIYFARPYASWQRGTNEHTNGLLRQFFPKGTDFARISRREVARAEKLLNERPRKRLGYRTPQEVLANKMRCN